ncbi:unnamed protein product [Miscanthus lutarioriparius]|uniref:F-box domain-containing protein n=1 Tax=Miscanthus lutarioriparius TaxID=422564 RepID=A0A811Q6N1_9POAL|nr:unnamed protein product [Miscanthus lutarioriparius]
MATSKVLGDDDLLGEILIRLDSPTSLVRAALVSKRWLRHASHRDFLRRFCGLRPPRLLGFFVTGDWVPRPDSVFDAFPEFSSYVWDCRNGRVLFDFSETVFGIRRFGVSDPLRYPDRGVTEFPPPPPPMGPHAMLLPDDEHDDASCYRVDIDTRGRRRVSAQVSVLRSGAWTVLSAWTKLDRPPDRIPKLTLLAGGKLYMVAVAGYIICMDLAAASLFVVEYPEGVAYEYYGNLVLCRGDNSVLYLFHVKGDRLSVWLRRMDEHGAEWVLRDTVPSL